MTLDALRCFCAVVDLGSFRRAAERVHRSQPAVSQQLKALETELGHTLLDRKTTQPTPAGHIVYERGLALLQGADGLTRELEDFDETARHELRVGTSDTNALYFLPAYVKAFAKAMPQTRLVVISRSSDAIAGEVHRGGLDLGIVTLPVARPGIEVRELFEQQLVLVTPKAHPLARRRRISISRLGGTPLVVLDEATRTGALLREFFIEQDFTPQVALDSGSFEVIKRYVAEGVGLSILPEMVVTKADRKALATVKVTGLPVIHIGAIWREGAYQTRAARAFLNLISEA